MNSPSRPLTLITGPTSGIGLEFARLFARDGHPLVLVARRQGELERLAAEMEGAGSPRATALAADLAEDGAATEVANRLAQLGLEVGILVNNAGYGSLGAFERSDRDDQVRMIQVNVTALVDLTRQLLPAILAAGRSGGILNVASTAAFLGGPHMATYYASKAFVLSFTGALAEELAGRSRVTCLCPGPVPTGFQERAGFGRGVGLTSGTLPMLSAATVAQAGYRGFQRGKKLVIPGLLNKATAVGTRLVPRRTAARIAGAMQKSRID
jgi:hypothetical protein